MPEQLTNEDLVELIQQGDRSKIAPLWDQVSRYIAQMAARAAVALNGRAWVDYDDLYNSGFLALAAAIDTYKAGNCAFTTWLTFYLKDAFAEAAGYRTKTQKNDPANNAAQLDRPLGDSEDITLADTVADTHDWIADTEQRIYIQQLHNALEDALGLLNEQESQALRLRHYKLKTLEQTGATLGVNTDRARTLEFNGLKHIRQSDARKTLESFIDLRTDFYLRTSVKSQKSPVELLVVQREEMRSTRQYAD